MEPVVQAGELYDTVEAFLRDVLGNGEGSVEENSVDRFFGADPVEGGDDCENKFRYRDCQGYFSDDE